MQNKKVHIIYLIIIIISDILFASDSLDAIDWFNKGYDAYLKKEYDKAKSFYLKAIEINPDYSEAYYNLGIAYNYLGNYSDVLKSFKKAIEINPDYSEAYYNLGVVYGNQGNYTDAIKSYEKAIEINPDMAEAYYNLGVNYGNQDNYTDAIKSYKKAIELNPNYSDAYYKLGVVYGNQGNYTDAIKSHKKVIEINPDYSEAYYNLGISYGNQGNQTDAIKSYKKAIELNPNYSEAHYFLGLAYSLQGKSTDAILHFSKAIELDPDYSEAYYFLGLAYWLQGKSTDAILHFSKAIELDPDYSEAYYFLGVVYGNQGDYTDAINSYKKAIELNPDFSNAYYNLGIAYSKQGNQTDAIKCYQKSASLGDINALNELKKFGQEYLKPEGFTLILPPEWCEIPNQILNESNRQSNNLLQIGDSANFDYGFQPSSAEYWFQTPYILIDVDYSKGRIHESEFKNIRKFCDNLGKGTSDLLKSSNDIINDINFEEPMYDSLNHILWFKMSFESDLGEYHKLIMISGFVLTQNGIIKLIGYTSEKDYGLFANVFRDVILNMQIEEALKYKTDAQDSNANWSMIFGAFFTGYILYLLYRKKKKM